MTGPDSVVRTSCNSDKAFSRGREFCSVRSVKSVSRGISDRMFRNNVSRVGELIALTASGVLPLLVLDMCGLYEGSLVAQETK